MDFSYVRDYGDSATSNEVMNIAEEKNEEKNLTNNEMLGLILEDLEVAEVHFEYNHTAVIHYLKKKLRSALGLPVVLTESEKKDEDMPEVQKPGDKPVR